jgi:cytochrome c
MVALACCSAAGIGPVAIAAAGDHAASGSPAPVPPAPALAVPTVAAATGDPDSGRLLYARCAACHSLTTNRTGPRHCGLIGRPAGSVAGFDYSEAMKSSGIVWTVAALDRFLADPMTAVPGTTMGYAGISDSRERIDLLAFLAQASSSAQCRQ